MGKEGLTHHEPLLYAKSQLKPGEASSVVPAGSNTVAPSPLTLPFTHLPSANCPSGLYAVMAAYLWPPSKQALCNIHNLMSLSTCVCVGVMMMTCKWPLKFTFYSPRPRNQRNNVKYRAEYFHPGFNLAVQLHEGVRVCVNVCACVCVLILSEQLQCDLVTVSSCRSLCPLQASLAFHAEDVIFLQGDLFV